MQWLVSAVSEKVRTDILMVSYNLRMQKKLLPEKHATTDFHSPIHKKKLQCVSHRYEENLVPLPIYKLLVRKAQLGGAVWNMKHGRQNTRSTNACTESWKSFQLGVELTN